MKITEFFELIRGAFEVIMSFIFTSIFRISLISILIFPYIDPADNFFYQVFAYKNIFTAIVLGFVSVFDQDLNIKMKLASSIINATLIYLVFCSLRNSFVDRFYDVSNGIQGQIKFAKQKLLIRAMWTGTQENITEINKGISDISRYLESIDSRNEKIWQKNQEILGKK
jgi:hypothetical protein